MRWCVVVSTFFHIGFVDMVSRSALVEFQSNQSSGLCLARQPGEL